MACFGIVWDHARAPYADIGYLALALFLVLTSFLAVGSFDRTAGRHDNQNFWLSRARRIALPWLFWCLVYRVIFEIVSDDPFAPLSDPMTLLIGPSIHLWFLPFVMLTLPLIPILSLSVRDPGALIPACTALIAVSLPLGWLHAQVGVEGWFVDVGLYRQPLPQWFFSLAAVLLRHPCGGGAPDEPSGGCGRDGGLCVSAPVHHGARIRVPCR